MNRFKTDFREPPFLPIPEFFLLKNWNRFWGVPSHYGLFTSFRVLQCVPGMMRTSPGEREESFGKGGKLLIWRTPAHHHWMMILITIIFIPVLKILIIITKVSRFYDDIGSCCDHHLWIKMLKLTNKVHLKSPRAAPGSQPAKDVISISFCNGKLIS